jgi:hypothetical protein
MKRKWNSVLARTDPRPRIDVGRSERKLWPVGKSLYCADIVPPKSSSFKKVFESRRSDRNIANAEILDIINALAFATRPRFFKHNDPFNRTLRPAQSAGALHIISTVIVNWKKGGGGCVRYDPFFHKVDFLKLKKNSELQKFKALVKDVIPNSEGSSLVLIADKKLISSVYKNPESLIWRDAGALMQTISMVFSSYRLAFCQLGILGGEIPKALGFSNQMVAVGVAQVGVSTVTIKLE